MDRRQESPFGVGIITIITVLLVLTLSIFAALTLTTAKADLALSEINAETVQSYYAADREAAQRYAAFASGNETELDEWIPMEGNQSLHITLGRIPSGAMEGGVTIEHWEVVASGPDESEIQDQWNLWDGGLGE
ncbi:hypothetical protein INF37_01115 [Pseudoflavonifractor sp. DSM 107456]|uniref:Type 4 fimbrial biogenesis protein PilX N-terminal domain-containing protein n=2 Tax=Pseudoflavonifractor TaxID=1017280 RepID=A0ABR9R7E0_9FIRM|nr:MULTISPECIES: hypothetical protein [Eubacteriales]MBC5730026.1 hypothetical protein [Pseudoflavonifractor hominis]MBE5054607.1 hypothetical protein [Pseudoflavonifractor gallinarum]MBT9685808.1 hypothetical protein [Pseudoflavonifractor sp. MCC625]